MHRLIAVMPMLVLACFLGAARTNETGSLPRPGLVAMGTTGTVVGDSLKIRVDWTQPTDGKGNADSTTYRFKLSKPWKWYADTVVRAANTWVKRKRAAQLSDSLRLLLPVEGDSVLVQADSVRQCRKAVCSVPGSFAFRFDRSPAAPPPMTFVRVVTDSF